MAERIAYSWGEGPVYTAKPEGLYGINTSAHMRELAAAAELLRLAERLEEAKALLRRLGATLEEEINGECGMARAELDLVDTRAFLEKCATQSAPPPEPAEPRPDRRGPRHP